MMISRLIACLDRLSEVPYVTWPQRRNVLKLDIERLVRTLYSRRQLSTVICTSLVKEVYKVFCVTLLGVD